jgi:hypothetical protein
MTRREKVMATTLIVVMTVLGGGLLFHLFVYQPISEAREELANEREKLQKAQDQLAKQGGQIKDILQADPRLSQWKKISLPPRNPEAKKKGVSLEEQQKAHLSRLGVAYERYLSTLLRENGFGDVVVSPRTVDKRANPILKAKEPVYEKLAFGVTGRGDLEAAVRSLKAFHQANLLHSIRNLTLTVAQQRGRVAAKPGSLDMSMQVEALLVNGAEERKDLLPDKLSYPLRVLAEPESGVERKYSYMLSHNIFTGSGRTIERSFSGDEKEAEDRKDVLSFVKLTMLCYDTNKRRWAATLYDQGKGGDEIKLDQRIDKEFTILDHAKNSLLEGKVVLIDEKQLIFKADGKYYRMHCGDFLYPCLKKEVSAQELKELGISP